MTSIVTDAMRLRNAKCFLDDINLNETYIFIGRPEPWTNDSNPPSPTGSLQEQKKVYQSITSYKPVIPDDISPVTYRFNWTSGVTYKMYDDTLTPSSQEIPEGTYAYYVLNNINQVFLCLYNGTSPSNPNGVPSVDQPTGSGVNPFIGPNDGYIWKYLYTLSSESVTKHLTSIYLPVENSPVSPKSGEIRVVYPTTTGSNMASNTPSVPYYYCNIVGDGSGAVFRFSVTNGTISDFDVVRTGENYTFANVDISDGRIYSSLSDLDNQSVPLSIGGTKPDFRIILPPSGGYTYDTMNTLSAYYLSVNSELKYGYQIAGGDSGFFTQMKFRQYGLVNKPTLPNGDPVDGSNYIGCYSVKLASGTGTYQYGETITQTVNNVLTEGFVVHWDSINKILFYIQTSELHSVNGSIIRFTGNNQINGLTSLASYTPNISFTGEVTEVNLNFIDGYSTPQLSTNADILYLSNIQPVQRSTDQIENLKFIIKF